MKISVLGIAVLAVIAVCAIITFRAMTFTTASWPSRTQRELRASSKVIEIKNTIFASRMEGCDDSYPISVQSYKQMVDPWGNLYHIEIADSNASNIVISGTEIRDPVAVWSNGKNRQNEFGKGDDIISWESGMQRGQP